MLEALVDETVNDFTFKGIVEFMEMDGSRCSWEREVGVATR
ncbi:hypothetical protein AB0K71_28915 [Streptomyces syringium]